MNKTEAVLGFVTKNAEDLPAFAIHCDTEAKARSLISVLYNVGFYWSESVNPFEHFDRNGEILTKWKKNGKHTCYSLTLSKLIFFGNKSFYERQGRTVVEYDQLFDGTDPNENVNLDEIKEKLLGIQQQKNIPDDAANGENKNLDQEPTSVTPEPVYIKQRKCPQCGEMLENDGSKFCMECGFEIPETFFDGVQVIDPKTQQEDELEREKTDNIQGNGTLTKNATKRQLVIIAAIVVFAVIFAIVVLAISNNKGNDFATFSSIWESATISSIFFGSA